MKRWLPAAAVGAATFVAFLPSLRNGFVNYDDPLNLIDNPHFRGFGADRLAWMFTAHEGLYMPLTWLSYAIDHAVWGLEPLGYHLTSLLIHAANAALLCALIRRLLPESGWASAAAGALLFSIHPLRVESVAWATERRDVLSGAFLLLSTLAYLRGDQGPRRRWLAVSAALYGCSLLSKGMALLFPAVLVVLDAWMKRDVKRALPEKIPFALLAAGAIVMAFVAQDRAAAMHASPLGHRVMQPAYRMAYYAVKTVAPVGLSPLVLFRAHESPFTPVTVAALMAVAGVTLALLRWRGRWPGACAAWCVALLLVAPSLGAVQVGPHGPADRYTYLMALPLSAAVAGALSRVAWPSVPAVVAPLHLALLGFLTAVQCTVWRDSETLWTHAIALDPRHHIAYYNRGHDRFERGRLKEALSDFDNAVRVAPRAAPARLFAGRAAVRLGLDDPVGALDDCNAALRIDRRMAEAHANAGMALERLGQPERAREAYRNARDLSAPNSTLRRAMEAEIRRLSR